ncbi:helix-turn-helix domain-containing protein [Aeromicrobium sp.]|uniref:helix-turn-helix domain-containing protein n=1 Tax=Aeromicrobium sp. TaxID=1871063 RepID=UPI0030C4F94C
MSDSTSTTPKNPDPLMTAAACAEYLGLSENFVRAAIRRGEIRSAKFGRAVRVRLSELQAYLDASAR